MQPTALLEPVSACMQRDDKAIENEGLENLTEEELRSACRARGMRAPFGSNAPAFMQRQLHDWLDLSLHRCLQLTVRASMPVDRHLLLTTAPMRPPSCSASCTTGWISPSTGAPDCLSTP